MTETIRIMTKISFQRDFMRNITTFIYQCAVGTAPADWVQEPHINIQRLYYVRGGKGWMQRDDDSLFPFEPGNVYLIPSNLRQSFTTDPDNLLEHIYFDFYTSPPVIAPEPLVFPVEEDSALYALLDSIGKILTPRCQPKPNNFGRITDAPAHSADEYCQLCHSLLHTLLLLLSGIQEIPFTDDAVVTETLEFIRENFASSMTVAQLAERAGFEENYFIRRFKRVMGITPYTYLRMWRLIRAKELIYAGETVVRAAGLVGYENASSLSRALRERTKHS